METVEYIHHELNQTIPAIGGHYVLTKEARLPFEGRELLYLVGYGMLDTACCGVSGVAYAVVPGFVRHWHHHQTAQGVPVSQVLPIDEPSLKQRIYQFLQKAESIQQVQFE